MLFLSLAGGLVILLAGGELVVQGSIEIASRLKLPKIVMGAIVVGFGTSLPEFMVTFDAAMANAPGLAVGNVFGSNISNILLILGLSAFLYGLAKPSGHLKRDAVISLVVVIGISLLTLQEILSVWQGVILFCLLLVYTISEIIFGKREEIAPPQIEPTANTPGIFKIAAWLIAGFSGLFFGARFFVEGAIELADLMGVSKIFIGVSVAAVGTSLPELAASLSAARRGEPEMAYGNIIGSNIFNVLGVLGFAAMVRPLAMPKTLVMIDAPVMVLATALLFALLWGKGRLSKTHGAIFIGLYCLYIVGRYFLSLA